MTDQMQLLLVNELQLLKDAREVLLYSYNKCDAIGINSQLQSRLHLFQDRSQPRTKMVLKNMVLNKKLFCFCRYPLLSLLSLLNKRFCF